MSIALSQIGPKQAESPVLISVSHAGRDYPEAMATLSRLNKDQLRSLEDRYADRLAHHAADAGHSVLLSHFARAWIDLNRAPHDVDPLMFADLPQDWPESRSNAKVRGGLGLVPSRIATGGDIWRQPLLGDDLQDRMDQVHTPFHDAIAAALRERITRFGQAILLDLHSMPPIKPQRGGHPVHLVVGDLYGQSSHARFSERVMDELHRAGFGAALNTPYAGGYILARHGQPARHVHAIQIEIDRRLYLDARLDQPGPGLATISRLVCRLADALTDETCDSGLAVAAE